MALLVTRRCPRLGFLYGPIGWVHEFVVFSVRIPTYLLGIFIGRCSYFDEGWTILLQAMGCVHCKNLTHLPH